MQRRFKLRELPSQAAALARVLLRLSMLKRPLSVLACYLRRRSPGTVDLKCGLRVVLSPHPHDIVTVFVVFLKRDYGRVRPGGVVFDVGANIGAFALYAAASGAERVYAFEPSREAFATLCANVRTNGLEGVVVPVNRAVGSVDGATVRFPSRSSPYNRIKDAAKADGACDEVRTVSLGAFMRERGIVRVDLLKMDCEGGEFDILPAMEAEALGRIGEVRMECHGAPDALVARLRDEGFRMKRKRGQTVWLTREP